MHEHGYTGAGHIGPTSDFGYGRGIDFIFTSDAIESGRPERVQWHCSDEKGADRDLSDHDGVVSGVEISMTGSVGGSGGGGGGAGK